MSTADCLEPMPLGEEEGAEEGAGLGSLHKPLEGLGDDDKLITSNGDAADDDVGHNDLKLKPGKQFNMIFGSFSGYF